MLAAVVEVDARPGDEVDDGTRYEHLPGLRDAAHPLGEMDGDPAISLPRTSISPVWIPTRTSRSI